MNLSHADRGYQRVSRLQADRRIDSYGRVKPERFVRAVIQSGIEAALAVRCRQVLYRAILVWGRGCGSRIDRGNRHRPDDVVVAIHKLAHRDRLAKRPGDAVFADRGSRSRWGRWRGRRRRCRDCYRHLCGLGSISRACHNHRKGSSIVSRSVVACGRDRSARRSPGDHSICGSCDRRRELLLRTGGYGVRAWWYRNRHNLRWCNRPG